MNHFSNKFVSRSVRKFCSVFVLSACISVAVCAQPSKPAPKGKPALKSKPSLKVAKDGFPAGHASPEGVACDLARAFIKRDVALFKSTCIKPFGGGVNRANYEKFLAQMVQQMSAESKRKTPSPGGPKTIDKVFAVRHLSLSGPASYGYAAFNFRDVAFVDVRVVLQSGQRAMNRTFVIQDKTGAWYVHPAPDTSSLLSQGLNEESASTLDFKQAYTIVK